MEKIPVGLVGVTGYTGMELARILAVHPSLTLTRATSRAEAGKPLKAIYPFLEGFPAGDVAITAADAADLAAVDRRGHVAQRRVLLQDGVADRHHAVGGRNAIYSHDLSPQAAASSRISASR